MKNILRSNVFDKEILRKRNKIIEFFRTNKDLREKILFETYMIGTDWKNDLVGMLWKDYNTDSIWRVILNLWVIISIAGTIILSITKGLPPVEERTISLDNPVNLFDAGGTGSGRL